MQAVNDGMDNSPEFLQYGASQRFSLSLENDRLIERLSGPVALDDAQSVIAAALASPLDYPALHQSVVPGDRVVILLDRELPGLSVILPAVWAQLASAGVIPADVHLVHPASLVAQQIPDPRQFLPAEVREEVQWTIHDPTIDDANGYLATSLAGERLYVSRQILDADVILPIGRLCFDSVLGYRGIGALIYPGFSTAEAFRRMHGQGHSELGPDDDRPLQQLLEEIGWLLGLQFVVQVVPSREADQPAAIFAGNPEAVLREGRTFLDLHWRLEIPERVPLVIAAVPASGTANTWEQVGSAVETARNLVTRGGRIVVLTDLSADPGMGVELLRSFEDPREALQPLREALPADFLAATRLARSADWAGVYLLSRLPSELVEDLFCVPLDEPKEVERLLIHLDEPCAVLHGAQYAFTQVHAFEDED